MADVLAIVEHRRGEVRDVSFEILSAAREMTKNGKVVAVLLGDVGLADKVAGLCDRLVLVEGDKLINYDLIPYLETLRSVVASHAPALVLMGHTPQGIDLAPALAAIETMPLATDVVELAWDGPALTGRRDVYGGKLGAHFRLAEAPTVMATVRPGSYQAAEPGAEAEMATIGGPSLPDDIARRFIDYIEAEAGEVDITAADVLVSVGRGIGKPENIELVEKLAAALGAAVSCSRPVADQKWLPKDRQVGTSGSTVRPKVYLALGISGAFQHVAGMRGAGTIIAVNKDPRAPIFGVAHYGIVADLFDLAPKLTEKIAALKG